jgi:hypothetical protein
MKKRLLTLLFLFAPVFITYGQFVRFGAQAGGGFSKVHGDDGLVDFTNYLAGLHGGFIGSYEFASRLALQAELEYSQKGFTYDSFPFNQSSVLVDDLRLHYLTLPFQLKLQKAGLIVLAGPYLGYLLAKENDVRILDRATANNPNPVALGKYELSINDFERWDYGYTAGLGLELDNGFFMTFHNTGGFKSFSKEFNQKNFGFKLSVGYLLNPILP